MTKTVIAKSATKLALTAGLLTLTGCSGSFAVYAIERGGALAFTVAPQGAFGFESCVDVLVVSDANDNPLWDIGRDSTVERDCENAFPITYGEVPAGFEETAAAVQIAPGTRYTVNGRSPGVYYDGSFMMTGAGQYVNFSRDEEVEVPDDAHR